MKIDETKFEKWEEENHNELMDKYEFDIHELTRDSDEEKILLIRDYNTWTRVQYEIYLDDWANNYLEYDKEKAKKDQNL